MKNNYLLATALGIALLPIFLITWFSPDDYGGNEADGLLMSGRRLPNFILTDVDGGRVSLDTFKGRVVLIFFGYTNCPDVCPMALKKYHELRALLGEKSKDVAFIFITTDPHRDSPEKMHSFIKPYGEDIIALTGTWQELAEVWKTYHVRTLEKDETTAFVTHSAVIYLGDRELILRGILTPEMPAEEMLNIIIKFV